MSGGTIYVSAEELDALQEADGILYALFEATDGEATSLNLALDALRSLIEKRRQPCVLSIFEINAKPRQRRTQSAAPYCRYSYDCWWQLVRLPWVLSVKAATAFGIFREGYRYSKADVLLLDLPQPGE